MEDIFGFIVVIVLVGALWSLFNGEEEGQEKEYDVVLVKKYLKKR